MTSRGLRMVHAGEGQALAFGRKEIASAYVKADSNNARQITTAYMLNGEIVKKLTAVHPNSALMRAFGHMAMNHYGANVVQVYSTDTGRLYGELKRTMENQVLTTFKADPTNFDDPLRKNVVRAAAFLLD